MAIARAKLARRQLLRQPRQAQRIRLVQAAGARPENMRANSSITAQTPLVTRNPGGLG